MGVRNEYTSQTIQAADPRPQRYQIDALLEKGHFQSEIADVTGISEGALSRELKRNTGDNGYCVLNQLIT